MGLIPQDSENNEDVDKLCDDCHEEIEEINRKFEAVRMRPCKAVLLEIKERFIAGEQITDDYIISMARSVDSPSCTVEEQSTVQEEEVLLIGN